MVVVAVAVAPTFQERWEETSGKVVLLVVVIRLFVLYRHFRTLRKETSGKVVLLVVVIRLLLLLLCTDFSGTLGRDE